MRKIFGAPAILAACMLVAAPAQAQFGGLLRKVTAPTPVPDSGNKGGCPKGKKGDGTGRKILGGIIRDTVGGAASKAGVYSYLPIAEVSGTLTDSIACRLDPEEQKLAAAATDEVTRGEEIGASSSWTSETRENVSGSSTVAAIEEEGGGRKCMNVNDFIIVDGEETRVTKRMCKGPGDARYALA
ncbi:MAG TPA: hypothetical protein PKD99_14740 [Sphingopyxis sp.]|nr:hypothetical protein [Sphingopyxis sp.]HMP46356.1 hypothetical protein [Sphingopyxis sp.]